MLLPCSVVLVMASLVVVSLCILQNSYSCAFIVTVNCCVRHVADNQSFHEVEMAQIYTIF